MRDRQIRIYDWISRNHLRYSDSIVSTRWLADDAPIALQLDYCNAMMPCQTAASQCTAHGRGSVVKYRVRIRVTQLHLSNCFRLWPYTSLTFKYSNGHERKFILLACIVLRIVYTLHRRTRKRQFEPICSFLVNASFRGLNTLNDVVYVRKLILG